MARCPCVKRGQACNRDLCKCRSCGNVDKRDNEKPMIRCRCGEKKRNENAQKAFCVDAKGQHRTRCPCFTAGRGCIDCKCCNCQNSFGVNDINTPTKGKQRKSKSMLSTPPSIKRRRGTEYMKENNVENIAVGWSQLESCVLDMTENFICSSSLGPTKENVCILYNFVLESKFAKCNSLNFNGRKTLAQISGKLTYKYRRTEAIWRLASGQ